MIVTTKLGKNSLTKYADVSIQTSQPMEARNRFAATQSLHTQFMLIDILYYAYVSRYYDAAKIATDQSKAAVTAYREFYVTALSKSGSFHLSDTSACADVFFLSFEILFHF